MCEREGDGDVMRMKMRNPMKADQSVRPEMIPIFMKSKLLIAALMPPRLWSAATNVKVDILPTNVLAFSPSGVS